MPLISFVALNIFLLFTLLDLHQPLRMWHIFVYPHFDSAITVGAWMATLFTGLITIMALIGFLDQHQDFRRHCALAKRVRGVSDVYENIFPFVAVLAIPVTLYTAVIMAESSARELWQAPTELVQMLMAAFMAGSAILLFIADRWSESAKKDLALVMMLSVAFSFLMYMGEYFFSFKSAEAEVTLTYVHAGGEYNVQFWFAMFFGFIAPFFIALSSLKNYNETLMKFAAITTLVGLYLAKDVWLKIPQLLPLS